MTVVLFDIDGTLVSTGGAGMAAFWQAFGTVFSVERLPAAVAFAGRTDRAIAGEIFRLAELDDSPEHWRRFHDAYVAALANTLPRHQGHVLPGIRDLVRGLHARPDIFLGLLTGNVPDGARLKLTHYGLVDYFPFGGFGQRHVRREEVAADALKAAHAFIGDRCDGPVVVIGDTVSDVQCGKAIGARTVAVATGTVGRLCLAEAEPDLVLDDFSDPAALFDLLGTAS